jgi:hypothetical protein
LAKFKGKDRAEALRAMVNAYVQEHSEHLWPLAERRQRDLDELVGEPTEPKPAAKPTRVVHRDRKNSEP